MARCENLLALCLALFYTGFVTLTQVKSESTHTKDGLLLMTVATAETDGFRRFIRSVTKYDLQVKVIGMGQEWKGGDIVNYPGGGFKVNLLKVALEPYKYQKDLIIMFTDSYDVVLMNNAKEIKKVFKKFNARVVFSAEGFCWPDTSLAAKYPSVKINEKRYLNSGGFIGYATELYEIVTSKIIKDTDDDQLFYTNIYLDQNLRGNWNIKLDNRAEIFQCLNGALEEVTLKYKGSSSFLYNTKTGSIPIVAHGNGPIKVEFNRLANYLADSWTPTHGCQSCKENTISLNGFKEEEYPHVYMALFIDHATPFLTEWFNRIAGLNYPKSKIDLYLHNKIEYHEKDVQKFKSENENKYKSFQVFHSDMALGLWKARNYATHMCLKYDCQYYFAVDSDSQLTNPDTLVSLIQQNRSVIAPMMARPGKLWSNFWGSLNGEGYYARSEDYLDIINSDKIGLWNVPFIRDTILIHGSTMKELVDGYVNENLDPDMALCKNIRDKGIFSYITNKAEYGHLIDSDNFETTHLHNDMYEIVHNKKNWEERYIHKNYTKQLDPEIDVEMPCPDVFWFPVFSKIFCKELIEEMEHFGKWSNGQNEDKRIQGGYESVPTRDIHMNQIGYENHWLQFIRDYIVPVQVKCFPGYYSEAHSIMNFVVRYRPDEQPSLRPHHDSSTFTINIALNEPGIDYEGGGCRFLRYNCSITASRVGWVTMHPGRLTHYHEGLRTTKGTRYIMISFIDP